MPVYQTKTAQMLDRICFARIGTLLLLAATVLLFMANASCPILSGLSILRVEFNDDPGSASSSGNVIFGIFGYCMYNATT